MSNKDQNPPITTGVRFILDGQVVEMHDVPPTRTLLQVLRDDLGRTGTKEGCAEGDCGACTVVVGELCKGGTDIDYRAVNACLRFLPTLDGREVVTVESLSAQSEALHPVQQAMLDSHASQCGFCTPGFVMSLFATYLSTPDPSREQVVDALAGNLCRCTGYRPIIDAGCRMNDYPEPQRWSRADAHSVVRAEALRALTRSAEAKASVTGAETVPGFHAPSTVNELASLYAARPDSLLLAGGTDIGLWVTKHMRDLPPLIYLGDVGDLKQIVEVDDCIEIGAAVPLADAFPAIVARYPMLAELANRFASPPIRNSGTLCGNIANGSPIGDSMPILIALGASVVLRRGDALRTLPLEDLYLGYQKKALQPGEFVAAVRIPVSTPGYVATYKIAKRFDQDISAVCAAYVMEVKNGVITAARIAYGGMAATPQRAKLTEAALIGQPWAEASMSAALPALAQDFQPLSDMRASNTYRLQVAGNMLQRFYLEQSGGVPARVDFGPFSTMVATGGAT
jgi:xanthine dehydrogenase small subunit